MPTPLRVRYAGCRPRPAAWRCAALVLLFVSAWPAAAAELSDRIRFNTLEAGAAEAQARGHALVVFFTADWCGWCRKMKATTLQDPAVLALTDRTVWAEVDIDERPDVAAALKINGVPAVAVANPRGQLLALAPGYQSAERFAAWLQPWIDQPDAAPGPAGVPGTVLAPLNSAVDAVFEASTPEEAHTAVGALLDRLSGSEPTPRAAAVERVRRAGWLVCSALTEALASDTLTIRAAAYDLLVAATGQTLPFDPFADPDTRAAQIRDWRVWIAEQQPPDAPADAPPQADPPAAHAPTAPAVPGLRQPRPRNPTAAPAAGGIDAR